MSDNTRRAIVFASITFASCLAMWMTGDTNYLLFMILAFIFV